MLVHPAHPLAGSKEVTLSECARQTVIAHNDPSHVRERVLRLFEQQHIPPNILMSLPSLEGIKRAVAMQLGVALLPRRCAESEIARGELVALPVPEVRLRRQVRLIYRKGGERSHASGAFLARRRRDEEEGVGPSTSPLQVREPGGGRVDFFVAIEQHAGRVPRSGGQRIAHVRRQRHGAAGSRPPRSVPATMSTATSVSGCASIRSMSACTSAATRSRTPDRSSWSSERRSRRTIRRSPPRCPSAAAPAARARATIRSRSSR